VSEDIPPFILNLGTRGSEWATSHPNHFILSKSAGIH